MASAFHRLTAKEIEAAPAGASLNDGGGLFYRAGSKPGTGKWVFRFTSRDPAFAARQEHAGKKTRQRDLGLGTYPAIKLAAARQKAAPLRAIVEQGRDPLEVGAAEAEAARRELADREAAAQADQLTFGRYADDVFLPEMLPRFSNKAHVQQWRSTFAVHAKALRDKPLAGIGREDVLSVLRPIWEAKNVTAARSRERMERLFAHAIQNGAYKGDNPATWRQFDHTLPQPRKLTRGHHAAIPHGQIAEFLSAVRARQEGGITPLMVEFIALSACRTGEARFATWDEIDREAGVWTIPAARMKMRRGHSVPITERMAELLDEAERYDSARGAKRSRYVFANAHGTHLSEMAGLMFMRRLPGYERFTVHGLRAGFKSWAATQTGFPRELIEEQLAHQLGAVERAYLREAAVERRRPMMEAWSQYCAGEPVPLDSGHVVPLKSGSGR